MIAGQATSEPSSVVAGGGLEMRKRLEAALGAQRLGGHTVDAKIRLGKMIFFFGLFGLAPPSTGIEWVLKHQAFGGPLRSHVLRWSSLDPREPEC